MKFSEQWLRECVNPKINTQQLCHQLTMAGLEVGAIEPVAGQFSGVIIGRVITAVQHPDADRLRVCSVDIGQPEPLQIVCGAANARPDIRVAVAMVGAILPGDFKIKAAKLRGVESAGMLCSAKELELAAESEGIIELPLNAPVGQDVREYLTLNDHSIEIELTPNRADCLSIRGIAREIGLYNGMDIKPLVLKPASHSAEVLPVTVTATAECPRYLGRVIRGINMAAPTPLWMVERLRRSGIRSISLVVDVTNYVMLLLGQPLHAFDLAKLQGGVHVRHAYAGEQLELLDGQTITLTSETVVIADREAPQALAGIMGGNASAISAKTTDIFLECAFFDPDKMMGKSRHYGIHTDSSYRFERGVDPAGMDHALALATQLIVENVGGQAGAVIEVVQAHLPKPRAIILPMAQVAKRLGIEIAPARMIEIFTRLGFAVETRVSEHLQVTVPTYRFDISIAEDLIEELARVYGYDHIPATLPVAASVPTQVSEQVLSLNRCKHLLVDRGYHEAITYSFIDSKHHQRFFPQHPAPTLLNPISSDMAVMRRSQLPGLLQALQYNIHRQHHRVRLFEAGTCFFTEGAETTERSLLSGVIYGSVEPEQWCKPSLAEFYHLKGDVEALLALAGIHPTCRFTADASVSYLHPGQSAAIFSGSKHLGYIGALHPELQQHWDFRQAVYVFELDFSALSEIELPVFSGMSKYPSIRRDIAMVVNRAVSYATIEACIRNAAGALLQNLVLFDVYLGSEIGAQHKSVAVGLTLQDVTRTLTDNDVISVVTQVVTALKETVGAEIRE